MVTLTTPQKTSVRITAMSPDSRAADVDAFIATCERLGGFSERVSAEWADGYLTALSAGPRAIDIDEWLPVMCGDAFERCFADPGDAAAARAALAARARTLMRELDPERLLDEPDVIHLSPLIVTWTDADRQRAVAEGLVPESEAHHLVSGAVWAEGFVEATRDFMLDWSCEASTLDRIVFEELLSMVAVLAWSDESERMRAHVDAYYRGEMPTRDALIDEACGAVQDLRVWWLDHGHKPATVHAAPKPGRNEPCHCGSGKKYKKCHGA